MLEFYQAFADVHDMMEATEALCAATPRPCAAARA
jgi:lysyl-tRNA synthetase class II